MKTNGNLPTAPAHCTLRVIDDVLGETRLVELERDSDSVLTDLLFMQRAVRKTRQTTYRLTLHVCQNLITLHFWSYEPEIAELVAITGRIPLTLVDCLKQWRMVK